MRIQCVALDDISSQSNEVRYGTQQTHFGLCVLAQRDEHICSLFFVNHVDHDHIVSLLREQWQKCVVRCDQAQIQPLIASIFSEQPPATLSVLLAGTQFQHDVWRTLLTIPLGSTCSYRDVAERMHKPRAVRAVAHAIARNFIAYLIPCHRVILSSGKVHKYRWGAERKKALIAHEKGV